MQNTDSDQKAEPLEPGEDLTQEHDLTQGSIPRHFRAMAVPMAVGMMFSTLYNVVDAFFAGLLSTDAQAGLILASQVFFFLIALGFGLSTALGALVGNALGEGIPAKANRIAQKGLVFGLFASVALTVFGWLFAPKLIDLISEPGAHQVAANGYLNLVLLGTAFFLLAYSGNGILQARGDTRTMKRAQIAAFFANLVLNPLFIFGIPGVTDGIGFNGLALSTICSQAGVMLYVLYRIVKTGLFEKADLSMLKPDWRIYRSISGQALPASFSMMVMMLAGFVVQFFLKDFGPEAVAGYGIALRIEQILFLPVIGLTGSLMPIAAQNYGAGEYGRVREAAFFCFKFGSLMMVIAGILLWLFGHFAIRVFSDDPEVIRTGIYYLRIEGLILWAYLMLFTINSLLQAFKKPVWTVWVGIYRQGIGVALFTYIYLEIFNFGVWGVWLGIATSVLTGLVLSIVIIQAISRKLIGGLFWSKSEHK